MKEGRGTLRQSFLPSPYHFSPFTGDEGGNWVFHRRNAGTYKGAMTKSIDQQVKVIAHRPHMRTDHFLYRSIDRGAKRGGTLVAFTEYGGREGK